MTIRPRWLPRLAAGALVLCVPALAIASAATQTYVYPQRGQSPKQQQQDFTNCSNWAVQQSGFDPNRVVAPPPPPPQERVVGSGALVRGAAGGAALGAVGGAIGGDAGKGAAIGAGVGALFGGMRRANEINQEQQVYQSQVAQQQAVIANGQANYDRAFAACMTSYGYSVR